MDLSFLDALTWLVISVVVSYFPIVILMKILLDEKENNKIHLQAIILSVVVALVYGSTFMLVIFL